MNNEKKIRGLRSFEEILPTAALRKLHFLVLARLLANLLDLLGLAGVATLSIVLSESFGGQANRVGEQLPLIAELEFSQSDAVLLALAVVLTFLAKSLLSITLRTRTAQFVATLEVHFATTIARDYFSRGARATSLSEFQNTAITSTEALSLFINSRIAIIVEVALVVLMVGLFFAVNPIATLGSIAYFGLVFFILTKVVRMKIKQKGERKMHGLRESLGTSRDLFGARREIRAAGVLDLWIQKFSDSREKSAQSGATIYSLASIPRYILETALVFGIFLFLGGIVVFSDLRSEALTIGVFMAGGVRLSALLVPLQGSLNQMTDGASRGRFAFERLCEIARKEPLGPSALDISSASGPFSLEMQNVTFSYEPSRETIRNVSFSVMPGQKVALVGPSGAGKTTCFEIATGFLKPSAGKVLIGGELAHAVILSGPGKVGIVPQRPHLVTGTLAENVSLESNQETDLSFAAECLRLAGLGHMANISHLKKMVEPDSGELSGGEIQRLGLARALYHRPGILFLDEATSALDAQTESGVNSALDELRGEMTVLLIAHRLSTVMSADKVIYLDEGKVVAEGSFAELQKLVPEFEQSVRLMSLDQPGSVD